jgi:acyl carrier protein
MLDQNQFLHTLVEIFRTEMEEPLLQIKFSDTQEDIPMWDSLAHIRIITGVEKAFNVRFEAEEMEKTTSIRAIYDTVNAHLS